MRLLLLGYSAMRFFYGGGVVSLKLQHPTWRIRISLFFWVITFDLSVMLDPASSKATATTALRIIWPHKPYCCFRVQIPSGGKCLKHWHKAVKHLVFHVNVPIPSGLYASGFPTKIPCALVSAIMLHFPLILPPRFYHLKNFRWRVQLLNIQRMQLFQL